MIAELHTFASSGNVGRLPVAPRHSPTMTGPSGTDLARDHAWATSLIIRMVGSLPHPIFRPGRNVCFSSDGG
jgi:hypothetical protein